MAPVFTGNWFNFGRNPSAAGPAGALQITGGTKTTHGSYTVHTFLGPGNLDITGGPGSSLPSVAFLLVGGGGGGGTGNANEGAGGGGGGGVVKHPGYTISGPGTYAITVGEGGAHSPDSPDAGGEDGGDTTFVASPTLTYTAKGGGLGKFVEGANGGCGGGGGGAGDENPGGSGTQPTISNPGATNYGNAGGMGIHMNPSTQAGAGNGAGGGGAGGSGEDGSDRNGGPGTASCTKPNGEPSLGGAGVAIDYRTGSGATYSVGGDGGAGFDTNCPASPKTANSGDGGDGSNPASPSATPGADGICVFRFPNTVYNG